MKDRLPLTKLSGRFQLQEIGPDGPIIRTDRWFRNSIQFGAADVIGRLLTGDVRVVPAAMYIEFTNDLGSWVRPTDFGRSGYSYYHSLAGITDIIRVPLIQTGGYEASGALYASNQATFVAQTAGADGVAGMNGNLNFTRSTSYVVGGGLIATPSEDDWSNDIVLTRGYVDSADALQRPADPNEIMLRWQFVVN